MRGRQERLKHYLLALTFYVQIQNEGFNHEKQGKTGPCTMTYIGLSSALILERISKQERQHDNHHRHYRT